MEPVLSVKYGKPEFLDEMLGEYTKPLETFKWDDNNKAASAKVFGQIMTKVWQAHAFREGNTRTTSVFMHQYASERGFDLDRFVTARYPSEMRDIFAKATVSDLRDLTKMLVEARETALERNHPIIGRLGEEAGQVLKLMGKPPINIPAVGENVRGQVLTTSYSNVLVAQGRDIKAVALANFDKAPANNGRINIVVKEPVKTVEQDNKP